MVALAVLPLWLLACAPEPSAVPVPPCVVTSVKTYTVKGIGKYRDVFCYEDRSCAFTRPDTFVCLRPLFPAEQAGEVQVCSPRTGTLTRLKIPQPKGFKPDDGWRSFEDEAVWSNRRGDLFLLWTLVGNGNHALGSFSDKSKSFTIGRSRLALEGTSRAIANPEGSWYLLSWRGLISVYGVDDKLGLKLLGSHRGLGHHVYGVLDACFVSNDVLHFVYVEVDGDNHAHFWSVEFNTDKKSWSRRRSLAHFEKLVSIVHPTVVMLEDNSLHYLWSIKEGNKPTVDTGLYYLAAGKKAPDRLSSSTNYKAIALGSKLVICYTLEDKPNKVFFRVTQAGVSGPESELTIDVSGHKDPLGKELNIRGEYMVLGLAGKDLLWFVWTQEINTFHELKVAPVEPTNHGKE